VLIRLAAGLVAAALLATVATIAALDLLRDDGQAGAQPEVTPISTPAATASPSPTPSATPTPSPAPIPKRFGLLDGVRMSEAEWQTRAGLRPVAVMVDNAPPGYPQTGLDRADLVIEALVEGGITRFIAFYWRLEAEFVEPVRSARTPFVMWALEHGALYAHAGSSEEPGPANAGLQIREWGVLDLDALGAGGRGDLPGRGFFRDSSRFAPYNLVASTAALREVAERLGYSGPPAFDSWRFKEEHAGTSGWQGASAIELDFGGVGARRQLVAWRWDAGSNTYVRESAGSPHLDGATGQQLRARNVVVMRVPWAVVDSPGHVVYDQVGSGPAVVFMDGRMTQGEWRKPSREARTRFFDAAGSEIAFNRGATWVEVLGTAEPLWVTP
jgi:hypothetical protein